MVMLKKRTRDVTNEVVGKLNGNVIELYLENEQIGTLQLSSQVDLQLEPNYFSDHQKIYQQYTSTEGKTKRYTDCDEGGWC
jgi:hypothetical protein